ncbi:hypothetical protein V8G54_012513 [Vigna mungo]|uniref:Reverse transcriptase Ty1/copia-type domain-containing protein n=1 Tax=Vigna mungo TaxID=3915 RepID=A0AAQ3NUC8_VIGMU
MASISQITSPTPDHLVNPAHPAHPLYLHPGENPSLVLVSPLLIERNFHQWVRDMVVALETQNKERFIHGTLPCPPTADPQYEAWHRSNQMDRFSYADKFGFLIFRIRFLPFIKDDYVIRFLRGLNESYAQVRSQIMMLDPMPSIVKTFSMVLQNERPFLLPTRSLPGTKNFVNIEIETFYFRIGFSAGYKKSKPTNKTSASLVDVDSSASPQPLNLDGIHTNDRKLVNMIIGSRPCLQKYKLCREIALGQWSNYHQIIRLLVANAGSIERHKARLIAKGFTQTKGMDFFETFSPVVKLTTVRFLISIVVSRNWFLYLLDVDNAFLHGDLDKDVYMKPPPGLILLEPHLVCKLHKSLYGLRRASRQWTSMLTSALISYVLTGDNMKAIIDVKQFLHQKFSIKDLSSLKFFLGFEVARSQQGLKQSTVSRSSIEVKYRALGSIACELQWLKYIAVDCHLIYAKIPDGLIVISHVPSKHQ